MYTLSIDYDKTDKTLGNSGQIKRVNGVNGIPVSVMPGFPDLQKEFVQMGLTDFRLHDCHGVGDMDDYYQVNDPYDNDQLVKLAPAYEQARAREFVTQFGNARTMFPAAALGMNIGDASVAALGANLDITDSYLQRILRPENPEREVIFRIGRTNNAGRELPEDIEMYAKLARRLVERYSLNYEKYGLSKRITYWEIWNEPDLTFFWNSVNPEDYYNFYATLVAEMKAADPTIKVGGTSVANGYFPGGPYVDRFIEYCHINNLPLDFYSWHYYGHFTSDPLQIIDVANAVSKSLNDFGFESTESFCTEWNSSPFGSLEVFTKVQSAQNAAFIASTLMYMQRCRVDRAHYYRGDGLTFGMFNNSPDPMNPTAKAATTYAGQAFAAFNELTKTPTLLQGQTSLDSTMTVLAGKKDKIVNILVANYEPDRRLTASNSPPIYYKYYTQHYVDSSRTLSEIEDSATRDAYFAGKNPAEMTSSFAVPQYPPLPDIKNPYTLQAKPRDTSSGTSGLICSVQNLPYKIEKISVRRIYEGGSLANVLPGPVSGMSLIQTGTTLFISDPQTFERTVTLYTITMGDEPTDIAAHNIVPEPGPITPEPAPDTRPIPAPDPDVGPYPTPTPEPEPDPEPDPEPEPEPTPEPPPEPKKHSFSVTVSSTKGLHPISFTNSLPINFKVKAGEIYRITASNTSLGIKRIMLPLSRRGFTILNRGPTGKFINESFVTVRIDMDGTVTDFFDSGPTQIRVKTFGKIGTWFAMSLTFERL